MAIGYLLLATLLAWCTFNAVAPGRTPRINGYLKWAFGFIIAEVPSVAFYLLGAGLLLTAASGGLTSLAGWAAVALTVMTALGLCIVIARQTHAGPAVTAALVEGLGPGWRSDLDAATAARLRTPSAFRAVALTPIRVRRRDVERVADIAYGDAGAANTLDIYRHTSRPTGCPVLVHFHGGSLSRGRKDRQGLPLIYGLASRGWLCISANYRLRPSTTFPGHLIDVKRVLAWVQTEGANFGADPSTVFIAGGSSGAQLASLAALTANDAAYQPGFENLDTSVAGAIALYGYYGPPSIEGSSNPGYAFLPMTRIGPDAPPFFVAHGDLDTLTSAAEARNFAHSLRRVSSSPVVYAELPGAQHGFDTFRSLRSDNIVDGVESFAAWVRATANVPTPQQDQGKT